MLLSFEHVTFGYTGVPIVKDVSFSVHEKERVGFLGGNGEGKTTILKLLTGELTPDEGNIVKKSGLTLGYLEQSGGFTSDSTIYGAMEELFEEDRRLIARLRETESQMASADSEEMRVLAARAESLNKRIAARERAVFLAAEYAKAEAAHGRAKTTEQRNAAYGKMLAIRKELAQLSV